MPLVVELNKAIYRLPKASQYFEEFLSAQLLKLGLVRTVFDKQLFVLRRDGNICYPSTDRLVACTSASGLHVWVQTQLKKCITLTSRPESNVRLVLVITRDCSRRSLSLNLLIFNRHLIVFKLLPITLRWIPRCRTDIFQICLFLFLILFCPLIILHCIRRWGVVFNT